MIKRDTRPSSAEGTRRPAKLTAARLDKLIEEATVDCYNDSEQLRETLIYSSILFPLRWHAKDASNNNVNKM